MQSVTKNSIMLCVVMLNVVAPCYCAECRYSERHCAGCSFAECPYVECHCAGCSYAYINGLVSCPGTLLGLQKPHNKNALQNRTRKRPLKLITMFVFIRQGGAKTSLPSEMNLFPGSLKSKWCQITCETSLDCRTLEAYFDLITFSFFLSFFIFIVIWATALAELGSTL